QTIQEIRHFFFLLGCLISRFPEPRNQQEVVMLYGKAGISYEQQQYHYGQRRFDIVTQVLSDLQAGTLEPNLKDVYRALAPNAEWRDEPATTPLAERYEPFSRFAIPTLRQGNEQIYEGQAALTSLSSDVDYRGVVMHHTKPAWPLDAWLDQLGLAADFAELATLTVTSKHDFQDKVASFYWKGCQLMPTTRGNSQTMLELHYILYALHGFQPPAVDKEVALPDCVALTTTREDFISNHYRYCFEHASQKDV
ncbi:MAG: hypothetical protein KDK65_07280, partial [Chlamydiia bacterium]|nr:hypothetical protein [Chlamydiia bacterium]